MEKGTDIAQGFVTLEIRDEHAGWILEMFWQQYRELEIQVREALLRLCWYSRTTWLIVRMSSNHILTVWRGSNCDVTSCQINTSRLMKWFAGKFHTVKLNGLEPIGVN